MKNQLQLHKQTSRITFSSWSWSINRGRALFTTYFICLFVWLLLLLLLESRKSEIYLWKCTMHNAAHHITCYINEILLFSSLSLFISASFLYCAHWIEFHLCVFNMKNFSPCNLSRAMDASHSLHTDSIASVSSPIRLYCCCWLRLMLFLLSAEVGTPYYTRSNIKKPINDATTMW